MSTPASNQDLSQRLGDVRVGIRAELDVSRHVFGGVPAYVIRDPITFKSHRLSPEDYQIFLAINADECLSETCDGLIADGAIREEQREEFFRFVLSLNQSGLLMLPVTNGRSLYGRFKRRREMERKGSWMRILFLRVPLFHPDAFLDRTMRWAAPLFTRYAFAIWLGMSVLFISLLSRHWREINDPLGTMLTLKNVPMLWTLLIVLKVFHEFGHAYACKRFGGQVPEMGAYFMLFTPCAYVDASASWGFPRRWHRILVGLGGMYFESVIAMVAVVIWLLTEPGVIHSAAQYAVLLSTMITVGFNANPLMKYDGYYILSDLVGIPNLRSESQRRVWAVCSSWLYGTNVELPRIPFKQEVILMVYGILCAIYKATVILAIATAIAFKIPAVGIGIAVVYVGDLMRRTLQQLILRIRSLPTTRMKLRSALATAVVLGGLGAVLIWVPIPEASLCMGVIGREYEHVVHARAAGFLIQTQQPRTQEVSDATILCRLNNPELIAAVDAKRAELRQLEVQLHVELQKESPERANVSEQLVRVREELANLRYQHEQLVVRAPSAGRLIEGLRLEQPGRYIRLGEPLAAIVSGNPMVEIALSATQIVDLRPVVGQRVKVRIPACPDLELLGQVEQVASEGSEVIHQPALTQIGGGSIPVNPETHAAEDAYFTVRIALDVDNVSVERLRPGLISWVRFPGRRSSLGQELRRYGLKLLGHLRLVSHF